MHAKAKAIGAAMAALVVWAAPAAASGPTVDRSTVRWTGCYVGAQAGMSSTVHDTSIDVVGGPSILSVEGFGSSGGAFGGIVGCDYQMNQFVIGVFADYLWHNQDWNINSALIGGGPLVTASVDSQWTIGARAGMLLSSNMLAYVLAGYTEMQSSALGVPILGVSFDIPNHSGITVGGGLEVGLGGGFFLSGEYRYTAFDRENVAVIPGLLNVGIEPEMHTAMVSLKYRLGFGQ